MRPTVLNHRICRAGRRTMFNHSGNTPRKGDIKSFRVGRAKASLCTAASRLSSHASNRVQPAAALCRSTDRVRDCLRACRRSLALSSSTHRAAREGVRLTPLRSCSQPRGRGVCAFSVLLAGGRSETFAGAYLGVSFEPGAHSRLSELSCREHV